MAQSFRWDAVTSIKETFAPTEYKPDNWIEHFNFFIVVASNGFIEAQVPDFVYD